MSSVPSPVVTASVRDGHRLVSLLQYSSLDSVRTHIVNMAHSFLDSCENFSIPKLGRNAELAVVATLATQVRFIFEKPLLVTFMIL